MNIFQNIFGSFTGQVDELRLLQLSLIKSKGELLSKSLEYKDNLQKHNQSKEYFQKSALGKGVYERVQTKFEKYRESYLKDCKTIQQQQTKIKKSISSILKNNPSLQILTEYDKFIPESKFFPLLFNLTKAHQGKIIRDDHLLELKQFQRLDLARGSVYVKDNRTHYADMILVNDKNEILFLVRNKNDEFEPGTYCLPGGHVEVGEDSKYAAKRECLEESGIDLDLDNITHLGDYLDDKIVIHYYCCKFNGEPKVLEEREQSQWEWVNVVDIKDKPLIKNLAENLSNLDLPLENLNPQLIPGIFHYYANGRFIKSQSEIDLQKSLTNIYLCIRRGILDPSVFSSSEQYLKNNNREIKKSCLYKSIGEVIYSVKLYENTENNLEKGHKYIKREGSTGSYKYTYPENKETEANNNYIYQNKESQDDNREQQGVERLSPEEEQGRSRGGEENVKASEILRRYEVSDRTEPERVDELISTQERVLIELAKSRKVYFPFEEIKSNYDFYGGGEEAKVFRFSDVTLLKVFDYKLFSISPLEFLDNRISLYNTIFPETAYELLGVTETEKGLSFIVEQPFIEGVNTPVQEITTEMEKRGFKHLGGNLYANDNYLIEDLHHKNVLKDEEGNLFFIDTVPSLNTPEEGYGGKRGTSGQKLEKSEENKIVGGKADSKSVEEIAWHHNCSIGDIEDELSMGQKIEMEHTDSAKEAVEIAKDHLWEIPDYYTRLKKMEKEAEEDKLEKAYSHKYLRREGAPGSYKYFYQDEDGTESSYEESVYVVDRIVDRLEKPLQSIVNQIQEEELKKLGRSLTDYDKEMIRLSFLSDMTHALGKYIKPTDELGDFKVRSSVKGNFKIFVSIVRDEQEHFIETDAIYAGGYNIQQLHYRYITKTTLPQVSTPVQNKYQEKLKKLQKSEKIRRDILNTERQIESYQSKIDASKKMTDEEILATNETWNLLGKTTWQDMIDRENTTRFDNSEEKFNESQSKYRQSIIKNFKSLNIESLEESVKSLQKFVGKLDTKLESELQKSEVSVDLEEELEKSKAAQIGEIRTWSGVKMQKTAEGWVPVKEGSKESKPEEQTKEKVYSKQELSEFAKETSEADLKAAAAGKDEKLRIAAQAELDRRSKEEKPQEGAEKLLTNENKTEKDLSIEAKIEELSDKYRDIVGQAMNDDFSSDDKTKEINRKQNEYSRYLNRVKEFESYNKSEELVKISEFLGLKSETEVKNFFGDGEILGAAILKNDIMILTEDCYCLREFKPDKKKIYMSEFILNPNIDKGSGKGTDIFYKQVQSFSKLGYERLVTDAVKSDIYNGYYTWARLGYNILSSSDKVSFTNLLSRSKSPEISSSNSLPELMSFQEGRDFWKKEGFNFEGEFDLKGDSQSMFILSKYIGEKKNVKK